MDAGGRTEGEVGTGGYCVSFSNYRSIRGRTGSFNKQMYCLDIIDFDTSDI